MMKPGGTKLAHPLKICFISRGLPVHRLGGLEHHLRDLALALAARGHCVHILTTSGGAADGLAQLASRVTISELPGSAPGDYTFRFFRNLARAATGLQAREKFDIIVPVEFAGLFLPQKIGVAPVVPLIHGTMTTETPLHRRYWKHLSFIEQLRAAWQFKARVGLSRSFWRMIDCAPAMIVDSEFSRRELLRRRGIHIGALAEKVYVVPLGIDLQRYPGTGAAGGAPVDHAVSGDTQGCPTDVPLRICLLGRLQKMKGIEIALRAAAQLRLRGIAFQMSIGGAGDYQDSAAALVRDFALENEVKLSGRVPPEELAAFFGGHDIFLFPDLTQPAFGLVAVEAMAYGLPVVAARSGAIPEVVTSEVGWLYDPWDQGELSSLLARIAYDRGTIAEKSTAARDRVSYYTAEAMAARTEAAIYRVLGQGAAADN